MNAIFMHANYAWLGLCVLGVAFMLILICVTQMEIPEHGGIAWQHGYDLADNPYFFNGEKASRWSDQWIEANNSTRGVAP